MQAFANKFILYLILLSTTLNVGMFWLRDNIFNDVRPYVMAEVAIAAFFLYEIMVILLTGKKISRFTPAQSVNLLLGLKAGKMLLLLLFILVYFIAVKIEWMHFVATLVSLYFIYLLFDTVYLLANEKKKKESVKN
jgi:hypothetical protein